ncbi:MAG: tRNA (adenosine(37)-N6)-threonylcarbamoyltransferase complex dimerization subunit type 1 TsaB [Oscillospiraceae bacterium]|nr:tRNA (adenosine(37)-N6)-threonylcarbamoyltransferase complex dimerization subunit type 1 TsaB [Oscillospiraceae bacterium]
MRILGLDTSGKIASAAVLDTERDLLLGERSLYTTRGHAQVILPMVTELLNECGMTLQDVDCYAVSVGPGSYTGLRIGIAAVQGLAFPENKPCIGVSTLEAMAEHCITAEHMLVVMHARADLFYSAWFSFRIHDCDDAPQVERETPDEVQTAADIIQKIRELQAERIVITGDGTEEFLRQYEASGQKKRSVLIPAPAYMRQQSATGVCAAASKYIGLHSTLPTAADLTASYLQAVNITKKS